MKNFRKHSGHLYTVKNQNGLNNALYDYFDVVDDTKKESIRSMLQNFPRYYPISIVIIDQSFECNRVYLECVDLSEASHETGWL